MVLGVVMIAAMMPTMIGLNEATQGSRQQEEDRLSNKRKARTHLVATVSLSQGTQEQRQQIHNATVQVGRDGKLYITKEPASTMVPYNGGFYTHPEFPPDNTSGLVTISGEESPTLRWVFLDVNTHELRWGGRPDSEGHVCGPFDWSKDETYVTLEGWEGWLAVRLPEDDTQERTNQELGIDEGRGVWRLYFDHNDDGADLPPGAQGLEIRLKRVTAQS
ncbi:hypothetical protein N7448_005330 [Penicillium atrosanguineum]|uniref:Uncharacterized protein n=1 Tax=Penicillium atrosanguineum TaxID=1132637 RepID=A0A9W9PNQ1_9EURO|nr:uncharacterized protein N7443_009060 [Penicillium atrosanguineum]KAJ5126021.1 hypothetical protein N7526_008198 [Penicillium atrosanguineum]KAJ5136776.1 hypothetical protein N7448_005330 [Penicillium atrosanguineum]KAJ5293107.1 hypothetical protein N7443_009060 [Penicillium atrosanguineum]KAJ5302856.1 hypothetical protein N7476_009655 [Penicillium atrosanguineum]